MELKIDPKEVKQAIDAQVQTIIAKAIKQNGRELIETVVREALTVKTDRWSEETVFGKVCTGMIRDAAKEAMDEWVKSKRPQIKRAVIARMEKQKSGFVDNVAEQLVNGLAKNFYVSVTLKDDD